MNSPVAVAMAFDAGYAPHAGAAIASVFATTGPVRFLLMPDDVPQAMRRQVEACAPGAQFDWLTPPARLAGYSGRGYVSRATYLRLGLVDCAPADVERLLYLDCDLIVARDLHALFRTDLGDAPFGAVFDYWLDGGAFARRWGLRRGHRYFNAGVLLLDLPRLRAEEGFSRALGLLDAHGADYPYNDQDALNAAFWGRWRQLDPIWNVQRAMLVPGHEASPVQADWPVGRKPGIVHFTSEHKPWKPKAYNPYNWLYHRARRATPFGMERAVPRLEVLRARLQWARRGAALRP